MKYLDLFTSSFKDYAQYVGNEVFNLHWGNYLYWLIGISIFFYILELVMPWRKDQPKIRKDFWLDAFYMFFNFFLFSLVGYYAISNVFVHLFTDMLAFFGIDNLVAIQIDSWPAWAQLLTLFILRDFIHWNIHRLLHKIPELWEFHKVHHSVEQMGFAAHLRFHWAETIVYRTIEYIPLAMIGFGIQEFLLVHLFALAIGHFNHSNIQVPLGPLKYIFNNPQMHIWHHAKEIPSKTGVNFGISLSIWDYLFSTNYIPKDGRDQPLGFDGMDQFPNRLKDQLIHGLKPKKEKTK